ncbi:hypothetical protein ACP4OV_010190 [Aristida adscensionis]
MGDFAFPATTTAAAGPTPAPAKPGGGPAPCRLPLPQFAAPPIGLPHSPASPAAAAADDDGMAAEEEPPPPPPPPPPEQEAVDAGGEAAAEDDDPKEEDRMDLLWEDFNEELDAALRRAGPCSRAAAAAAARYGGLGPESESDMEFEPAMRSHHGCVPVLRPSSRVGGAGHYRRRAGSWVLLMRIFRRLFVIDKTVARRRASALA